MAEMDTIRLGGTDIPLADKKAREELESLSEVARSGSYNDLLDKPFIPPSAIVDDELSTTSDNAVQNKVITQRINDINSDVEEVTREVMGLSDVARSGSYTDLSNKPTIPSATSQLENDSGFITSSDTVDNATLWKGETNDLATENTTSTWFTVMAPGGVLQHRVFNPNSVPTKTSDLQNDSGFITSSDTVDNATLWKGETNDLATENTTSTWFTVMAPGGVLQHRVFNPNSVPTKTSDLQNDSGFITSSDIPSIPTKTSQLDNDSGFITNVYNGDFNVTNGTQKVQLFADSEGGSILQTQPKNNRAVHHDVLNGRYRVYLYQISPWDYLNDLELSDDGLSTGGTISDKDGILIKPTYSAPFNKLKLGSKAIIYGLTNLVSINTTNAYGSSYYAEYTIKIPSNVRLSALSCVNVQALSAFGLIGVNILEQAVDHIKIRIFNSVSGEFDMNFSVQMFGNN